MCKCQPSSPPHPQEGNWFALHWSTLLQPCRVWWRQTLQSPNYWVQHRNSHQLKKHIWWNPKTNILVLYIGRQLKCVITKLVFNTNCIIPSSFITIIRKKHIFFWFMKRWLCQFKKSNTIIDQVDQLHFHANVTQSCFSFLYHSSFLEKREKLEWT